MAKPTLRWTWTQRYFSLSYLLLELTMSPS